MKNELSPHLAKLGWALVFLLASLASCKKSEETLESKGSTPLFLGGSLPSQVALNFDVVIQRNITFQNPLTSASPGWKRLQAVPETESYSLQVNAGNNSFYMLKENILLQSVLYDRIPIVERIAKIEIVNGISTSYNPMDDVISADPTGELSEQFLESMSRYASPSPVDTSALVAQGVNFTVSNNNVSIINLISQGDGTNSTVLLDLLTGLPKLVMFFDDNDLTKLTQVVAHKYNASNQPLTSAFTYYDYLDDGDVRKKTEHWAYSNYSLTIQ